MKQLFGSNISVQHQDVPCFENENPPHILYNVQTETYSWNENGPGHGGSTSNFVSEPVIVDFYQENNTYVLETRHAFYGFSDDDTHDYYGSYEDAQNKTNKICTLDLLKENGIAKVPDGTECLTEENSKISRYLFQVENGKLYLAKYEVK